MSFTKRFFSDNLKSQTSIHAVSKLSEAKERPKPGSKIYSALHGPSANRSVFFYNYELSPDNKLLRKEFDYELRKKWNKIEPLYLYHGERYCIDIEKTNDNAVNTFNENIKNDGSKQKYEFQNISYDRYNSQEELKKNLRNRMKATMKSSELKKYPIKKVLF